MKTNIAIVLFSLAWTVQSTSAEHNEPPKVGSKAAEITSLRILDGPKSALSWSKLSGKTVVLEFWATWCGPCVGAISHMNTLAEKFKDKGVQFIAITDEEEDIVKNFLKKKPIVGWVCLDSDQSVGQAYGAEMIPHTVVIDAKGDIAEVTDPVALTEQRLNELLAGKSIASVQRRKEDYFRAGELPESMLVGKSPLYQIIIRPSLMTNSQGTAGGGGLTQFGCTLSEILPQVYPFSSARIIASSPLSKDRFDFVAKAPDRSDETRNALLKQAIESAFGIAPYPEKREINTLILTLRRPDAKGLTPATTRASARSLGPGRISAVNISIDSLRGALEKVLEIPVIDETRLNGEFDVELKWNQPNPRVQVPEAVVQAVRDQLGLDLNPAKRVVEVLVVSTTKPTAKHPSSR